MMPERMGTIGKTQGVRQSSSPKPKKLAMTTQKPPVLSSLAIFDDSSPLPVGGAGVAIGAAAGMALARRLTVAFCGVGG